MFYQLVRGVEPLLLNKFDLIDLKVTLWRQFFVMWAMAVTSNPPPHCTFAFLIGFRQNLGSYPWELGTAAN